MPPNAEPPVVLHCELKCPHCCYDLTGLQGLRCPECGFFFEYGEIKLRAHSEIRLDKESRTQLINALLLAGWSAIATIVQDRNEWLTSSVPWLKSLLSLIPVLDHIFALFALPCMIAVVVMGFFCARCLVDAWRQSVRRPFRTSMIAMLLLGVALCFQTLVIASATCCH